MVSAWSLAGKDAIWYVARKRLPPDWAKGAFGSTGALAGLPALGVAGETVWPGLASAKSWDLSDPPLTFLGSLDPLAVDSATTSTFLSGLGSMNWSSSGLSTVGGAPVGVSTWAGSVVGMTWARGGTTFSGRYPRPTRIPRMNAKHMPTTSTTPTESTLDILISDGSLREPLLLREALSLSKRFMARFPRSSIVPERGFLSSRHIFSGASTPSRASPFFTTKATAVSRWSRASVSASSPAPRTWWTV